MKSLVSICVITYNQENYIRETLDSIISQKTSFPIEIIIGDDCSTDKTKKILMEFCEKYSNISYVSHKQNKGIVENLLSILQIAKGKYIAISGGDDYWINPFKLQKQYDFLESKPDFAACFHNAIVKNEINKKSKIFARLNKTEYTGFDIIRNWLIPAASIFGKNIFTSEIPEFIKKATHEDLAIYLYLLEFGKMGCINSPMSVYRIHNNSITQTDAFKGIEHNLKHVRQIELMIEFFGNKYKTLLKKRAADYLVSTAYLYAKEEKSEQAKSALKHAFRFSKPVIVRKTKYFLGTLYYIALKK